MNKTIILLFALVPVLLAATCSDIPSFQKLQAQASTFNSDTLNSQIDIFAKATPATQTGLDFCKGHEGKTGCCTKDFISAAKDAIEKSTENLKGKKPIFGIILKQLQVAINKCNKAGTKIGSGSGSGSAKGSGLLRMLQTNTDTATSGQKDPNQDQTFVAAFKKCQIQIIQAQRKFKRGAFCSLCMDPAEISKYFQADGSLIVTSEALTQYKTAMAAGFKCLADFNTEFLAKVKEATDTLDQTKCPKVYTNVQTQLENFKLCTSDDCSSFWLSQIKLFADDVALNATPDENNVQDVSQRRQLGTTGDISDGGSNGYASYISDASDDSVTVDGVSLTTSSESALLKLALILLAISALLLF